MFKGGFPPIYPIDTKINNSNEPIKRNFSNIIDINTILKKKTSRLINMVAASEAASDTPTVKKKKRNFKNILNKTDDKAEDNFLNFINDLSNIKKINRINKTKKA
jgi:predicted transcriptional regulator